MKIKQGLKLTTQDFFYDLFDGGCLDPAEVCEFDNEAKMVLKAIRAINEFRDSIEKEYPEFFQ